MAYQYDSAATLDDYRAYFGAYRDTVDRWGKPADYGYGWELFEQCHALSMRHPDQIKLWLIVVDERDGRWHDRRSIGIGTAVAWHGAMCREYLRFRAMNVVDTEIIRDAIALRLSLLRFQPKRRHSWDYGYKGRFGAD